MSILRLVRRLTVVSLLVVHAGLLLGIMRGNFIVIDEIAHVPAGLSHWQTGTFSLDRVNPPLARMLAALPLLLAHPKTDYQSIDHAQGARSEWAVGRDFITANGPRSFDMICLARLAGIGWSLLGGWLIYCWARELYGDAGGCLALTLWCFDPTVLAFSAVATADIPAAVAGLLATYAFRRYLRKRSWSTAVVAGLALGVALLVKYTLILLCGLLPLLWLLDRGWRANKGESKIRYAAGDALLIVAIALYVVNLGYGFRHTGMALKQYSFVSHTFTGYESDPGRVPAISPIGNRFRRSWLGELVVPLPADYLGGIDIQRGDLEGKYSSYLNGQWRDRGWWYYYLEAFAIKEPIGILVLILWSLGMSFARGGGSARISDELSLAIPAAIYLAVVSSHTGLNHHMRYVLPMFPYLIIGTGKLAHHFRLGHIKQSVAIVVLAVWAIVSSLSVYPQSMSYFNETVGGPENGHAYLLDSNIDWGQDLLRLKDWLRNHPEAQPLGLAYFNEFDPKLIGIDYHLPPLGPSRRFPDETEYQSQFGPHPGYYAISVSFLRGKAFEAPDGRGGWTNITRHDAFTYFRQFPPIARAGNSIYIYHITPAAAELARRRMGLTPLDSSQPEDFQ